MNEAKYKRADDEARGIAFEAFGCLTSFANSNPDCPQYLRNMAAKYERRFSEAKALRQAAIEEPES